MKEGWEYKKLGEICDFRSGFAFKSNKFTKIGEPIIRISDIQNEEIDDSNLVYFDPKSYTEDLSKYLIYPDDILIAMSGGTTGKLGINTSNRTFYLNQRVGVFRENKKYLNHRYLFYYLHTKSEESLKIAAGAAQPNLSTAQIKSFLIPVPSLSEQQSIVDYLDSAFAKIDAMKANAEKALNEAKALFQASLKEMLEPKEGWEEKTLREVCTLITDGTHHSPPNNESGKYKYITAKNIKIWGLDLSNITYVSEDIHKEIVNRCNPRKGDVLYIKDGATTGIAIVNPLEEEFSMLSSVALIKPNKDVLSSDFLCYTLNSPSIYNQTRNQMDGAAITRVTLVKIKGFVVYIPPISEQQSIVATLDSLKSKVDRLKANYEKISQECDALKQAILRQVFE